jgi:hypothetical protein
MSNDRPSLTIRSFRLAFALERRIHKVDRFRLPLPYGLPLRSLAYALAALFVVVVAAGLPVIGAVFAALPWPVRFGVLPVAAAQLLTQIEVDGRPAHEVAGAWLRYRLGPRVVVAFARTPRGLHEPFELVVAPDERGTSYRRGVVAGPGAVLLRQHATAAPRGSRLVVRSVGERPDFRAKRVFLKPGQRVVVH